MRRPVPVWRGQGWEELVDARQATTPRGSVGPSVPGARRRSSRSRGQSRYSRRFLELRCPEKICAWMVRFEGDAVLYVSGKTAAEAEGRARLEAARQGFRGRMLGAEHACRPGAPLCPQQCVLPLDRPKE